MAGRQNGGRGPSGDTLSQRLKLKDLWDNTLGDSHGFKEVKGSLPWSFNSVERFKWVRYGHVDNLLRTLALSKKKKGNGCPKGETYETSATQVPLTNSCLKRRSNTSVKAEKQNGNLSERHRILDTFHPCTYFTNVVDQNR